LPHHHPLYEPSIIIADIRKSEERSPESAEIGNAGGPVCLHVLRRTRDDRIAADIRTYSESITRGPVNTCGGNAGGMPPSEVWRGSRCAATLAGMAREDDGPLHDSEPSLGGDTIDEAVENSEEGTQAEDTGHTPSGNEPSGDSRGEQMKDVVEHDED